MTVEEFYKKHTRITRSLRNFISGQEGRLSAEVFRNFLDVLGQEIERVRSFVMQQPSGPARAQAVQEMVDFEIAREKDIASSCQKGCSHCCHMEVEITNDEAELLAERIREGFVISDSKLETQSSRLLQDPKWRELALRKENGCVFLDDHGVCGVYDIRPMMCRRHSVTSPAKFCETMGEMISVRYFPRVDIIISAANEDPSLTVGPLAKMLSLALKAQLP